jgi:histidinol-phosphate aminotransferase
VVKLNTNENPYPPSPKVAEAIRAELDAGTVPGERLRLYSDPAALALREAASESSGVPIECILHGNGSDELLVMLMRAFVGEGEAVAYPYPTYVLYETLARAQGARTVVHDFDRDFGLPNQLFGCDARLVFIASPSSPSGTRYPVEQLERLGSSLTRGVLVVDEAYAAFADGDALGLVGRLANVVVLRTLSKSHSLAGMRVGLAYASAEIIAGLNKVKDSYNLDRLAIVAGAASLRDSGWTAANRAKVLATRSRLCEGLRAMGLDVVPSEANFVFVRMGSSQRAAQTYRDLRARGILVRYFAARLLDDGLRITVGTDAEIDALLDALRELSPTTSGGQRC